MTSIGEEIKDGTIAFRLLKPISYNLTFISQEVGEKVLKILFVFIPVTMGLEIYKYFVTGFVNLSPVHFILYMISIVFAYLINAFSIFHMDLRHFFQKPMGFKNVKRLYCQFYVWMCNSTKLFAKYFKRDIFIFAILIYKFRSSNDLYGEIQ